jgi:hypothetical protein
MIRIFLIYIIYLVMLFSLSMVINTDICMSFIFGAIGCITAAIMIYLVYNQLKKEN